MHSFENDFYRVVFKKPGLGPGTEWRAKATIFRKDSGERVESTLTTGPTPEEAQRALQAAIGEKLDGRAKPPDWGRDPEPPAIIASYLQLREQLYTLHLQECEHPEHARQAGKGAQALETACLAELKTRINSLSESQKLVLFKPTSTQAARPSDPWNLDDLTVKEKLFRFLDNSSPCLQSAAQEVRDLLKET